MANPNPSPATRFTKGWSGGPGAPKGPRLTNALVNLIDERGAERALAVVWLNAALKGDFRFYKELLERVEGKIPDRVAVDDVGDEDIPPDLAAQMAELIRKWREDKTKE